MLNFLLSTLLGSIVVAIAVYFSNKKGITILSYLIVISSAYAIGSGLLSLFK